MELPLLRPPGLGRFGCRRAIAAWAAATPEAVAVDSGTHRGRPTASGGASAAARRSTALPRRGARRAGRVYAERSAGDRGGMLAVLMAGGAFLPLDRPPRRASRSTLEDSRVPCSSRGAPWPPTCRQRVRARAPRNGEHGTRSLEEVDPEDIAYIIYNSARPAGPRGCSSSTADSSGRSNALAERSGVEPGSGCCSSPRELRRPVWEIWSTLIRGADPRLRPLRDLLPGQPARHYAAARNTNCLSQPSALAALRRERAGSYPACAGGGGRRGLPPPPGDPVGRGDQGRGCGNAYGPTEASICVPWRGSERTARLRSGGRSPTAGPVPVPWRGSSPGGPGGAPPRRQGGSPAATSAGPISRPAPSSPIYERGDRWAPLPHR